MADINDYVRTLFWTHAPSHFSPPDGFVRDEAIIEALRKAVCAALEVHQAVQITDTTALASDLFNEFVQHNLVNQRTDPFAGTYFQVSPNRINKYRQQWIDSDAISKLANEIGSAFFLDVFRRFEGINPLADADRVQIVIPASDRIVTLSHNRADELEEPIEELIAQLERDNGIPDEPGLKERLIGQIKAGRELIRSGNFRAYLLHVTLIRALGELIERYKGTAIAMVAASLIDLLVKTVLQVS